MIYRVLGTMSGSSLDGLDFALVEISNNEGWRYNLIKAQTVKYPKHIISLLTKMPQLSIYEYL